jgi:hypothetical protein
VVALSAVLEALLLIHQCGGTSHQRAGELTEAQRLAAQLVGAGEEIEAAVGVDALVLRAQDQVRLMLALPRNDRRSV